jgi:acetolactate synthase-1/2/3 large subunit
MAQAEITGSPGACLTTLGPGAASAVNGVACAYLDRAPLLLFTDTYAAAARPQFEHQRLDHAALFRPVTKLSTSLAADRPAAITADAVRESLAGRPGPVHIECPGEVLQGEVAEASAVTRNPEAAAAVATPSWARLNATLAAAHKPLIIAGLGARRPADAAAVRQLCEARRLPAMVTYKARGVVHDDHPWFAGVFTNGASEQPLIDECDLLIGVGLDPVELLPRPWTRKPPIVYCGPWPVDGAHVPFVAQLVAPVADAAAHVERMLLPAVWDPERVRTHACAQRQQMQVGGGGLTAQRVVELAAARLGPSTGTVTVDAGAHMLAATTLWPVRAPNGMLISNGLSTMGFALPAAIGAALVDRGRGVVALTGDGGLLMCAGDLLTAAREGLPVIVIVFADESLSLIEIKQQARGLPAAGVELGAIDWPAVARGMGVEAFSAATGEELDAALEQAAAGAGPCLIEARIDRSNYGATLRAIRG